MNIAFLDFYPSAYICATPAREPLGGSQSATAYLTAALAKRGHRITVFNAVNSSIQSESVEFVPLAKVSGGYLNAFDVVIVVSVAIGRELRTSGVSRPIFLWCHHDTNQPAVQTLRNPDERVAWNGFAMLTRWQAKRYAENLGISQSSQRILGNAAAPAFHVVPERVPWFSRSTAPVLYYSSTPFRGLEVLLDAMSPVRSAIPGTRLRVFSSMKLYGVAPERDQYTALYERCRTTEGVEYVGPLAQSVLANEIARADVHAYPCTFPETSCIAAMESMAAGSMIVATRLGALAETTAGFAPLLEHADNEALSGDKYAAFLIRRLTEATTDDSFADRIDKQREFARRHYAWEKRAEEWEQWLSETKGDSGSRVQATARASATSAKATGNLLRTAGDMETAISWYRRALDIEPDNLPALYNLGMALHEVGNYDEAEICFQRLLVIDPDDAEALFHLGALLFRRMRFNEAEELLQRAIRSRPDFAEAVEQMRLANGRKPPS